MSYLKNLLTFSVFLLIVTGCGGGNTTIANNSTGSSNSSSSSGGGTSSVTGGSTGTLTLKWVAPTARADGTNISLSEISGFRIYYGSSATDTPNFVNINNGSATQYTISLPVGSYYFRISAVDSSGYEGLKSNAIAKSI